MVPWSRHLPVLVIFFVVLVLHLSMWRTLAGGEEGRRSLPRRLAVSLCFALLISLLAGGLSLSFARVLARVPRGPWISWVRAAALGWALLSVGVFAALWLWRGAPRFDLSRRRLLRTVSGVVAGTPVLAGGFGAFVERSRILARPVDLKIAGLPRDLDGLRLAQLTDIHLGPFLAERELERSVEIANDFKPHLALVTGDLISDPGDPLDACLARLARLRASDGVYGCLGNHEGYARVEGYTARQARQLGIEFLRSQHRSLRVGAASLNLAGVDYQKMGGPYLEDSAGLVEAGSFNVLLSHNPDVFPDAAAQGYDLVISGHTHGGQINFEIFDRSVNVSKFYTPFVYGQYRQGNSLLYVSRGIGTVAIPVRLGAPPEVNLIRLCAT
jgi:predicted MPP superfamily phosphohydrolase